MNKPNLRIIKGDNKPKRKKGKQPVPVKFVSRLQPGGLQSTHVVTGSLPDEEE